MFHLARFCAADLNSSIIEFREGLTMRRRVETVGATQGLSFLRQLSAKARRSFSPEHRKSRKSKPMYLQVWQRLKRSK